MYEVVSAFGEAYQLNGNWYQDYIVKNANGGTELKRYAFENNNWVLANQDTIQPISEAKQVNGEWEQVYSVTNGVTGEVYNQAYRHNGSYWYPVKQAAVGAASGAGAAGAASVEAGAVNSAVEANERKKINLIKKVSDENVRVNLEKHVVNLDKCIVNLSKKSGIQLGGHRARVAICLDYSASMRSLYKNGAVQETLSRVIPLGLQFDDNGEVDVWLFHGAYHRMDTGMDVMNFNKYIVDVVNTCGERFGGTSYAPVLRDVHRKYAMEEPNDMPAFVIFLTDGANDDRRNTDDIVRKLSEHNIFVQFIGQNSSPTERFDYLRKLDDLSGRNIDNTGFFNVADLNKMSDAELYNALLEQYVSWINEAKRLGILR